MLIPLVLMFLFVPIVYGLGCSVKDSVKLERHVSASVPRLHRLMKKREKLAEFNPLMYVLEFGSVPSSRHAPTSA